MARPDRPSVSEEDGEAVSALLDTDRRLRVRALALEIGEWHMTVFRIVKKRLGMLNNCFSVGSLGFDRDVAMATI